MTSFATDLEKQERRETIAYLRGAAPADIAAEADRLTINAFHRQIRDVAVYRELFSASAKVAPECVVDMQSFRKFAPILDKHVTFGAHHIRELCRGGTLQDVRSILTSSGHSGVFSFGVNTLENLSRSSRSIDTGLEYVFGVDQRSTLLINALPMGVKINTKATVLAETSVREDMVFALVKKFAGDFEQIIIVAEGSFAKKIIEDGAEYADIEWPGLPVSLITGEEGIAENYRTYIAHLIGADRAHDGKKLVMSSMGIAELDLNIFHETPDTIAIRRLAHADPTLRRALFGESATVCPMLFVYYPTRCYVEEHLNGHEQPELVLSMLSDEMKIPLLRYRTGDFGRVFDHHELCQVLARHGYDISLDLKLPFVAVYGRGKAVVAGADKLTPEEVKEAIYMDHEIAAVLTGNFRMSPLSEGTIHIDFQLRKAKTAPGDAAARILKNVISISPAKTTASLLPYRDFPHAMEVDWERKFRYI